MKTRLLCGILTLIAYVAPQLQRPAAAQRAVVFQHGILSSGETWQQESVRISQTFVMNPFLPSLTAAAVFGTQSFQLRDAVSSADSDAILVGHSNGGIVGRVANMAASDGYPGRSWGGIVTVGTPHIGAPLAQAARNGDVSNWLVDVYGRCWDPVNYYSPLVFGPEVAGVINSLNDVFDFLMNVLNRLGGLLVTIVQPVTRDMVPGSDLLNTLNSQTNLNRESSALPVRIGITSSIPDNTGLIWKGLFGATWSSKRNIQQGFSAAYTVAGYAAMFYDNDDDPNEPDIRANAYRLLDAAAALNHIDADWCVLIGADVGQGCGPSDGIIPAVNQVYPGPGAEQRAISGPSHTEETKSDELDAVLQDVFRNTFSLPTVQWPGEDPYFANISGTDNMRPGDTCHWTAITNIPNGQYRWMADEDVVGTSPDLYYSASSDFLLRLDVTNVNGFGNGSQKTISVSSGYSTCQEQRPSGIGSKPPSPTAQRSPSAGQPAVPIHVTRPTSSAIPTVTTSRRK